MLAALRARDEAGARVGTRAGSTYSEDEYTAWLNDTGFDDVRRARLPGPTDFVIGTRPSSG